MFILPYKMWGRMKLIRITYEINKDNLEKIDYC